MLFTVPGHSWVKSNTCLRNLEILLIFEENNTRKSKLSIKKKKMFCTIWLIYKNPCVIKVDFFFHIIF